MTDGVLENENGKTKEPLTMRNTATSKRTRTGLVAALDIGTTKICCLIARANIGRGPYQDDGLKIIGIGHQVSEGLRSGAIVNLDDAEASIRATVEAAEQMAEQAGWRVLCAWSSVRGRVELGESW